MPARRCGGGWRSTPRRQPTPRFWNTTAGNELGPALRALIAQGHWDDLHTQVSDDVLDHFCMAGTYDTIAARVRERLGGLVDRVVSLPLPDDAPITDGLGRAVEALKALPTARETMP